jgi:hypothetical protein
VRRKSLDRTEAPKGHRLESGKNADKKAQIFVVHGWKVWKLQYFLEKALAIADNIG